MLRFSRRRFCFASFTTGSRKCILTHAPTKSKIILFPVAHAAVPAFYNQVLIDLDEIRSKAEKEEEEKDSEKKTLQEDSSSSSSSTFCRFNLVVEGASETIQERQIETEELALIQKHVKNVKKLSSADAAVAHQQEVKESVNFVNRFIKLIETDSIYPQEQLQQIAAMYQLPFPLPHNLVLQDAYLRPRVSFRHGDVVVNGDIVGEKLDAETRRRFAQDQVAFHRGREMHCVETIMNLLVPTTTTTMMKQDEQQKKEEIEKTICVLWGHYHCPRILEFLKHRLQSQQSSSSSSNSNSNIEEKKNLVNLDFENQVHHYGWSKQMVQDYFNIDGHDGGAGGGEEEEKEKERDSIPPFK